MEENWKNFDYERELDLCGVNYRWKLSEIQKYLTSIGIASQNIIDRPSIISYDNKAIFVNVIGLQDLSFLEQAFDLSIDSSKFEEGVLIGS